MGTRQQLREMVNRREGLVAPGAYDGVSAKLIERAGFEAVYMTGFGTSASRLGLADLGFAGLAEMADQARNIAMAVSLPVIADADTGYGNALNVRRTVQTYEATGVAALHIEDQALPKRCGHLAGKVIVPTEEFGQKIRAAVEARTDPDLLIIARTDAIAVNGFDDAMRRAEVAAAAGADVLFIEAPTTEREIETISKNFDLPLLFNYAPGGRTPLIPLADLRSLRYAIIILPIQTLLIAVRAVQTFLGELKSGEVSADFDKVSMPFPDFNDFIGVTEQMALGERYT